MYQIPVRVSNGREQLQYLQDRTLLKVSKLKLYLSGKSLLPPAYRTGSSICQPEAGALSKGEFPLIKGGQGVVILSFAITPHRKFFGTPLFKITPRLPLPAGESACVRKDKRVKGVMIPIEEGRHLMLTYSGLLCTVLSLF
jgi:hypothetical protein